MKNYNNLKSNQNIRLIFSLAISLFGLCLALFDNSIINNGILGIGVLISGYSMMKLENQ